MGIKLLVFSDTHGDVLPMYSLIEKERPDKIIHLGDTVKDISEVKQHYQSYDICYVSGNNDFGLNIQRELIFDIDNIRIFATHGHAYNVKNGLSLLLSAARERNASIVLFGHTHKPCCEYQNGILLFNPGSLSYRGYSKPTYGILHFEGGKVNSNIYTYNI